MKNQEINYDLKQVVNSSIQQTLTRSIFTSATTFVMVLFLYILGVESMRAFAMPLAVGIVAGAFSSIFISGALYYILTKKNERYDAQAAARAAKYVGTKEVAAVTEGAAEGAAEAVSEAGKTAESEVKKITANPNRKKKKKRKQ